MRAFAKINIGLWIKSKREDGYHTIETVFLPVDLYDEITIEKSDSFTITGPNFGKDDLMVKGHRLLEDRFEKHPVAISIEKNIPVGAGLAGGTADGAALMRGVRDLYDLPMNDEELIKESVSLGADFPYCFYNKPAIGRGIGEELEGVEIPSYPLILLNPGFSVSTPEAYSLWKERGDGSAKEAVRILKEGNLSALKDVVSNDLMAGVAEKHDVIYEMIDALYREGAAFSHMTGSGPTVYGIFDSVATRDAAYAILKDKFKIAIKTRTRTSGEGNG